MDIWSGGWEVLISMLQNQRQENITRLDPKLEEGKAMAFVNHFLLID